MASLLRILAEAIDPPDGDWDGSVVVMTVPLDVGAKPKMPNNHFLQRKKTWGKRSDLGIGVDVAEAIDFPAVTCDGFKACDSDGSFDCDAAFLIRLFRLVYYNPYNRSRLTVNVYHQ